LENEVDVMRRFIASAFLVFVFAVSHAESRAQDAELIRHFEYDQKAPLGIKQIGSQRRASATVYDITYDSPKGGLVPAYLVVPKGRGPFAAVIWGHWYWGNSSLRNRKEFLDEAIALAAAGVISLLTDGPIARPGHADTKDPETGNVLGMITSCMTINSIPLPMSYAIPSEVIAPFIEVISFEARLGETWISSKGTTSRAK
jgi:hypothetical protein